MSVISIGAGTDDPNSIGIYVRMIDRAKGALLPPSSRKWSDKRSNSMLFLQPVVSDTVGNFGSKQPFLLYVRGDDLNELKKISD